MYLFVHKFQGLCGASFILGWQGLCGTLFSPDLVFAGLCLVQSKIYMLAGGRVAVQGVRLFGKWLPCALCGVSGGNIMIGALRTSLSRKRIFSICSLLLFSVGLRGGWPRSD